MTDVLGAIFPLPKDVEHMLQLVLILACALGVARWL